MTVGSVVLANPLEGNIVGGITFVISLVLAAATSSFIIAMAWIFLRPYVGVPLLVVTVASFACCSSSERRNKPYGFFFLLTFFGLAVLGGNVSVKANANSSQSASSAWVS
jgi:uncharacterized membrane protein AbrB (regulator of aidB expression)